MTFAAASVIDRAAALERFRRMRARTRAMFDLLDESVYYERPIPLRNPVVFYEGHLPAFAVNTLLKRALGRPGIDAELEDIFARGIDPHTEAAAIARGNPAWPARSAVRAYAEAADRAIEDAITSAALEVTGHPTLDRGQALWTILEHEEMHQETLAYMWHEVAYEKKHAPGSYRPTTGPKNRTRPTGTRRAGLAFPTRHAELVDQARIPAGIATLGTGPDDLFAWDNERPSHRVDVPAFAIDVYNVTNAEFMAFVEAGGYRTARWWRPEDWAGMTEARIEHPRFWMQEEGTWFWRGMFERIPLPRLWPVYVTWAEANAFARWRGMRLPTEAEFHRAAFGAPSGVEQLFPWSVTQRDRPVNPPGNLDFRRWDPVAVGSCPGGASPFGVHDLVGNGWEWTSTTFGPFEGFAALPSYPEYSADFFDGDHFVLKGASPVTAAPLIRRGFRNWFRPGYPYVYASFRCVASGRGAL